MRIRTFTQLLSISLCGALGLGACITDDDDGIPDFDSRDEAVDELERLTGAPIAVEIGETGVSRVLAMTHRFPVTGHATDPAVAAHDFLRSHHDAFKLDASDAAAFTVTGVDRGGAGDMRHVTLQRVFNGIPVYQGAITVHMDAGNGVFRALGDDSYQIAEPTNRQMLTPADAVAAAARALGVNGITPQLVSAAGQTTTFTSSRTLEPIQVDAQIYQVAPGDNRYAYQTLVSWLDETKTHQWELAMIDAMDGTLLHRHSLMTTFSGRVFTVSPGVNPQVDARVVASFDGDPTASPSGWVGAARNTSGNNAAVATDLNANNAIGTNEVQPVASAADAFDFPYSPLQPAANSRAAAVASAFFLTNDFHDRVYALGFNEASRNFQLSNFGRGGAQNDPVNVDVQDGGGTNNANFGTPPDGARPRMQLFIFTTNGGPQEDSAFDATVVYHEYAHGLSNRLVGGGSTGCLGGVQSGGMGEGWGDFLGGSFINTPLVGAYVTGNATRGIRQAPMNNSPFTYANIKDGTMTEVHAAGEIWAATLWDVRTALGAAVTNQLVVSGMKLTPCRPSMLQARDAIIQADAQINAGANRCRLWTAFARRQMGTGAVSPTNTSTTAIVLSTAVPADCNGQEPPPGNVVFSDDFETDRGWQANPNGTDTATTGQWQRANPETTTSSGTKQQGTTVSGNFDLVTGGAAGNGVGANDVDGGTTSIQSPAIAIPAGGTVTLSMSFYFAHLNNSTNADFFRVQVVGTTTATVIEELGAAVDDDAAFVARSVNISQFAGQTVRILISTADAATGSLIEAAVDNVQIARQ